MPNREREQRELERLRTLLPEFGEAPISPGDRPDGLVELSGRRIGIEHTVFYLPPEAGKQSRQELNSLRWRIVRRAEAAHRKAGGPGLYLTAAFHEAPLAKRDIGRIAAELMAAVLNTSPPASLTDGPVDVPWDALPAECSKVWLRASIDGKDRLWNPMMAAWVCPVTSEHVLDVIRRKEQLISSYRAKCDEVWLLISHRMGFDGIPVELTEDARSTPYLTQFDRVMWLDPIAPRVEQLLRVA